MQQRPWYDTRAFGRTHPSPAAYRGRLVEDPYLHLGQEFAPVIEETVEVFRQGGQLVDEATLTARQFPLERRPQATLVLTAAIAGAIGGSLGRPVLGALIGAGLGWFAHRTWAPEHAT